MNGSLHKNKSCFTVVVVLLCSACAYAQVEGDSIIGKWYTEKCQALFDFYRCGQEYRAKMYPLEKPDMVDVKNPEDSLRTRKLYGVTTVYGLTYDAAKKTVGKRQGVQSPGRQDLFLLVRA